MRVEQILDRSRRRSLPLAFRLRAVTCLGAACAMGLGLSLVSAAPTPSTGRAARPNGTGAGEKPPGGPVSGRVVTPDGRPVAGATVWWVSQTEDGCTSTRTAAANPAAPPFLSVGKQPVFDEQQKLYEAHFKLGEKYGKGCGCKSGENSDDGAGGRQSLPPDRQHHDGE